MHGENYKEEHELFVSNLTGSSLFCVVAALLPLPALLPLASFLQQGHHFFLVDFATIAIPSLLSITLLADYFYARVAITALMLCGRFLQLLRTSSAQSTGIIEAVGAPKTEHPKLTCLTNFKGANILMTCMAILAVDFPVFPRYFAKTESFGLSLMDIGTGVFIVTSAWTSRYARGLTERTFSLRQSGRSLVVLLLAFARVIAIKALHYPEHVSEYGVHWNFFATLFAVWTCAEILHRTLPRYFPALCALVVMAAYQLALQGDLTPFLLSNERGDFVSANKEGIWSLIGYLSLYLIAEEASYRLFFLAQQQGGLSLVHLTVVVTLCFAVWMVTDAYVQPTSRRLCNVAYVTVVLALCFTVVAALHAIKLDAPSPLLERCSAASLPVFLAANLMTGAVNSFMQTIHCTDPVAFLVLVIYSAAVSLVAWKLGGKR
eukprot:scaffold1046_cov162-Ochromonas_danica.AAC.50